MSLLTWEVAQLGSEAVVRDGYVGPTSWIKSECTNILIESRDLHGYKAAVQGKLGLVLTSRRREQRC